MMTKCACVVMLVLLGHAFPSFGQAPSPQETEVAQAWHRLLKQLETGSLAASKELMTDTAFASLMQGVKPTAYGEALRRFAVLYQQEPLRVRLLSPTEAALEVGRLDLEAGYYPSGFRIEYRAGKWQLVAYYPSK
ncbi:hypothetical protein [Hymenobacter lapidiphilus]|uniref:DUF4878 domain-containing protein n=1 Tax=Hymenobacter lapidiphilus TaxID=2608003 RepID=A0A7Y7PQN4_9BACT|nr:hypothetical protein [Hymenobacter lapidiphilus]NVO32301.1 hypothetical protein [Hymenobacter lapidiphilus]